MPSLDRVLFIRADDPLVSALDAAVERVRAERPGERVSRSDLARSLLWRALRATQEAPAEVTA